MTSSDRAEIMDLVRQSFEAAGGRETKANLQLAVAGKLPGHLIENLVHRGLSTIIAEFLRQQTSDGLPQAPRVDDDGTHAQLQLLSVDEWRYLVASYVKRADANLDQASRAIVRCRAIHGVTIDVADPFNVSGVA